NEAQNELELSKGSEDNEGIKERTGFRLERRVAAVGRYMGRGNPFFDEDQAEKTPALQSISKCNGDISIRGVSYQYDAQSPMIINR
ncbi:hypothetical protein MJL48_28660, partial [Salmonella enterica subsp. enterica serovar Kentucky]|nr:hypothetical protein [Salmonella enterica subsp. enterica serovar Kentucky]